MAAPRILIVSTSALCRNPRVVKEATTLGENGYDVTVLTVKNHAPSEPYDQKILAAAPFRREVVDLLGNARLRLRARTSRWLSIQSLKYLGWQSPRSLGPAHALLARANALPADLTIVHNEVSHWVGLKLMAAGRRIAADIEDWHSEDLLPADRKNRPLRLLRYQERALLNQALYTSTTSEALAGALHARYGGKQPYVITNSFPLQPRCDRSDRVGPPAFFWFSQTIGPGRGLEKFLAAWCLLRERSHLILLGQAVINYDRYLLSQIPISLHGFVHFRSLVSPDELPSVIAENDLGLALEESSTRSRDLTITNKILQYLNAGLAVIATDTAGQREVFSHQPSPGLLVVDASPEVLARRLDALLSNPMELAHRQAAARQLAESTYCWEREAPKLLRLVDQALAHPHQQPSLRNSSISTAASRRVLIVAPTLPPLSSTACHRVRVSLPYYRQNGWEPIVVTVNPQVQEGPKDDRLLSTLPAEIPVVRCGALPLRLCRTIGIHRVEARAWFHLLAAGLQLLKREKVDVVFLSTPHTGLLFLGYAWLLVRRVPFIVDFPGDLSPTRLETHCPSPSLPPGKQSLMEPTSFLGRWSLRRSSGLIVSTEEQLDELHRNDPRSSRVPAALVPHGASPLDLEVVRRLPRALFSEAPPGTLHFVAAGPREAICPQVLTVVFKALRRFQDVRPRDARYLRLEFVDSCDTTAADSLERIKPLATSLGVGDRVIEVSRRIDYLDCLRVQADADALLLFETQVPASSSAHVAQSYLANRPTLAVLSKNSPLEAVLRELNCAVLVVVEDETNTTTAEEMIYNFFSAAVRQFPAHWLPERNEEAFRAHSIEALTAKQTAVFDLARASRVSGAARP